MVLNSFKDFQIELLNFTNHSVYAVVPRPLPCGFGQLFNHQVVGRVQTLGGVAVGDPRHVAEIRQVPRAPDGCEEVPAMLSRLLEAHEIILSDAHDAAARVAELGDDGTNDLIVSEVIRTGELQAWFLAEHLVDTPLVRA